jgi:hypothetical protein
MDLLFVIDDSGSMEEEQSNLAANFPRFIEVLDAFTARDGGPLDYRVGVTTTGVHINIVLPFPIPIPAAATADGELQKDCGMSRKWIERADGDVAGTFGCVANVGTDGSGMEMPLRAAELAFVDRVNVGANAGVLREDALLAIVFLTDEDDCSNDAESINLDFANPDLCDTSSPTMQPVGHYVSVLDAITGDRGRWATAVIAGPRACSSSFGDAAEAARMQQFVYETGDNAIFSSICDGDLASALEDALNTFDAACDSFPPLI